MRSTACEPRLRQTINSSRPSNRPSHPVRCKAGALLLSRPQIPIRSMCRTTIPPWSMDRGLIRIIRPTIGRHHPTSAMACLRPGWPSAPAGRSAIGGQEVTGAATSTGAGAATISISPRRVIGPRIPSSAEAATGGSRESTTGRPAIEVVNATSAATAVNRFSIPAIDLVLATGRATGPAPAPNLPTGPAAAATLVATVPIREPRSPIAGRAHGRAQKREPRTAQQASAEAAGNTRTSLVVVAVEAAACADAAAAAVALWRAVAAVAVAAVAVAVAVVAAADAARILD